MTGLADALAAWGPVTAETRAALERAFTPWSCAADAHLAHPGEALERVLFVERGLLRFYTLDEAGREWNKGFVAEGGFTGPLSGEASRWPAPHGLQALEGARGWGAPAADFRALCARHPGLDHIARRWLAQQLEHKRLRVEGFQRLDAAARYREFLRGSPELARRLPQYHIASYLGITEVTLSRLHSRNGA